MRPTTIIICTVGIDLYPVISTPLSLFQIDNTLEKKMVFVVAINVNNHPSPDYSLIAFSSIVDSLCLCVHLIFSLVYVNQVQYT